MFSMQCSHRCVGHCEHYIRLQCDQFSGICPGEISIATSYSMFDQEILAEHPSFLFENSRQNVDLVLLQKKSPNTARAALSVCATGIGDHRKTENKPPPLHAPLSEMH